MTDDDGRLHILAGGDLVVVTPSLFVADAQHLVMVGAGLDVERWRLTEEQWAAALTRLRSECPEVEVVDTREEVRDDG